jgi:hypothetical protein
MVGEREADLAAFEASLCPSTWLPKGLYGKQVALPNATLACFAPISKMQTESHTRRLQTYSTNFLAYFLFIETVFPLSRNSRRQGRADVFQY